MANIDVIRNTYGGMCYLENAIQYVQDERANYLDSFGVSAYSLPMAMNQMVATRRYFGKVSGNPLVHVVISYDSSVTENKQFSMPHSARVTSQAAIRSFGVPTSTIQQTAPSTRISS